MILVYIIVPSNSCPKSEFNALRDRDSCITYQIDLRNVEFDRHVKDTAVILQITYM